MKVIFLDVDGVLNTGETFKSIHQEWRETGIRRVEIDLFRVEYLKKIVDEAGALIVLSSSWRKLGFMEDGVLKTSNSSLMALIDIFSDYGLSIYDITPNIGKREDEIMTWINNHDVESFVVIDDDSYDLQKFLHKELIKTSFTLDDEMISNMNDACGLCKNHIDEAIKILNRQNRLIRKK